MGVIKKKQYILSVLFKNKKNITKKRKEILRANFGEFKDNNKTKSISFKNENLIILSDGENLRIISKDYINIEKSIEKIFHIFEVKDHKEEYIINIMLKFIVSNNEEYMEAVEESQIISSFLGLKNIDGRVISSIEYITFSETLLNEGLISVHLGINPVGIEIKVGTLLDDIKEIANKFEELNKFSYDQVVDKMLAKVGEYNGYSNEES